MKKINNSLSFYFMKKYVEISKKCDIIIIGDNNG